MRVEVFDHFFAGAFCHTYFVFGHECELCLGVKFFEFALGRAADRAFFGSFSSFVYVAADYADKFLFA